MEIKTVQKIINEEVYISTDGIQFLSPLACKMHEEKARKKNSMEAAETIKIHGLEILPINTDSFPSDTSKYAWYKVNNEEEFNVLNNVCSESIEEPTTYPEVYCIEYNGCEFYEYNQTDMFNLTKKFWKKLGYRAEFFID